MNIAINASLLDDKHDGARVYALNIINEILNLPESEKHNFTIFTPITKYFKENKNVRVIKISSLMLNSKYGKFAPFFRFFWNNFIYTFIAKDFDISYSPTANGSMFLKNQIVTIHDLLPFRYPELNRARTSYFKLIIPRMLKNAKKIYIVSLVTKNDVIQKFKCLSEKIKIIPCAYNPEIFKLNKENKKKNLILVVGATYEYKNINRALLAYSSLPNNIKNKYKFVIAGGREDYLNILKNTIKTKNLEKNVKIFDWVHEKELAKLYQNAALLIYPSLFEGFGIPPLEAMASGCPVALSNIPATKEVCGNAAYYFDPNKTDLIKKSIIEILENKRLRKGLIAKGLKRSKEFSWKSSARKALTEFENF